MRDASQIPVIRHLLGSLVSGHAYLFHGDSGTGKSVLGMQCAHAWLRGGGAVLYLTGTRPTEYFQHAAQLGFPLEPHWRSQQLILGTLESELLEQFAREGAQGLLGKLDEIAADLPVSGLVIDPFDPLLAAARQGGRQPEVLTDFVDGLAHRGWTTLILSGDKVLKDHRAAQELLTELCWATVSMRRCSPGLWDRIRGDKPPGSVILDIDKARQPTPSGGGLTCEVTPDAGLLPVSDPGGSPDQKMQPTGPPESTRALFISDEPGLFDPLIELLEGTVEVEVVRDGVEGLSRAVTWAPQVILAETELPRLSGFGIARALRQGRYGMPILLFSQAARRHSERVRAYLNGATDFVYYPYDSREMVYKVRVLSQMVQHRFPEGVETQMMDALLSKARSHILSMPAFFQALSLSLHTGVRLSAPVSLLGFSFSPGGEVEESTTAWEQFKTLVDTQARNGDLICTPADDRLAVLLCHETQHGARAFAKRLGRELARAGFSDAAQDASWRISIAMETIQLPHGEQPDLRELLEGVFADPRPFQGAGVPHLGGTGVDSADDEPAARRWGT